ncbi:MAG: DUF748 domain-containing protein [Polyangiales bacterium]
MEPAPIFREPTEPPAPNALATNDDSAVRRAPKAHAQHKRRWPWVVLGIVALLIGIRAVLPFVVERYVNKTLAGLDGYSGSVADIDLSLWRGAYQIHGLRIVKTGGRVPVPFVEARTIDLAVEWRALLRGKIVAEIALLSPKVNFVNAKKPEQQQAKVGPSWTETLRDLVPFDINRVVIRDGQAHYRDFESDPRVDVFVQKIDATLRNITNSEAIGANLYASFEGKALAMGSGRVGFRGRLNPYANKPTFDFAFSLDRLKIKQLNNFLQAYANVDAEAGTFALDAELSASRGRFEGYVKPFIEDLQVLKWDEEKESFFGKLWEGVAEVIGEIFENQPRDQIATRIPVSGSVDSPSPDVWATMFGLIKNAFLQALRRGLEGSVGPAKLTGLKERAKD